MEKEKPKTFKKLIEGYERKYDYEEWDTREPVGNEDIYNNPEYMKRLLKSKKQIEYDKGQIRKLIDE